MYRILRAELVKQNIPIRKLAIMIQVSEKTMRNKINGETEFTWSEVCKIHKIVNPSITKEELFQSTEKRTNVLINS